MEYTLTFHILNVYFDKTEQHQFLFTFKGKLQSEQLLRVEGIGSDAGDESDFSPPPPSPAIGTDGMPMTPTAQAGGTTVAAASAGLAQGQIVSGGTVYQMVQTPHGLVAQPIQVGVSNVSCIIIWHPYKMIEFSCKYSYHLQFWLSIAGRCCVDGTCVDVLTFILLSTHSPPSSHLNHSPRTYLVFISFNEEPCKIRHQRVRQLAVHPCLHGRLHVWSHFPRGLKPHTRAGRACKPCMTN